MELRCPLLGDFLFRASPLRVVERRRGAGTGPEGRVAGAAGRGVPRAPTLDHATVLACRARGPAALFQAVHVYHEHGGLTSHAPSPPTTPSWPRPPTHLTSSFASVYCIPTHNYTINTYINIYCIFIFGLGAVLFILAFYNTSHTVTLILYSFIT